MVSHVCGLFETGVRGKGGAELQQSKEGACIKGYQSPGRRRRMSIGRKSQQRGGAEWIANQSISQLSKQIKEMGAGFSLSEKRVGTHGEREEGLQNLCAGKLEFKKSA